MQKNLIMILKDVYGGDGFTRPIKVKNTKLTRTKTSSRKRSDIGIAVESTMDEVQGEMINENVNTFELNTNGKPVLRLGGSHGKLWGTFKSICISQKTIVGNPAFKSSRIMDMIQVFPVSVELEPLEDMQMRQLPQKLNTMGNSMIFPYFDVIPRAKCQVSLIYPDNLAPQIDELIKQLYFASTFNKRRTTIEEIIEESQDAPGFKS